MNDQQGRSRQLRKSVWSGFSISSLQIFHCLLLHREFFGKTRDEGVFRTPPRAPLIAIERHKHNKEGNKTNDYAQH